MKKLILIALALSTVLASFSQERGERIQQLKIAFLTEELNLSVEEGQSFWPVYNEYQELRKELNQSLKQVLKDFRDIKKVKDSDVSEAIDKTAEIKLQLAEVEADYLHKSLAVLGAEKTVVLVKSEKKFKERILRDMRNKQSGSTPQNRPGRQ